MNDNNKDKQEQSAGFRASRFMVSGGLDALIAGFNFALAIKFFTTDNGWFWGIVFLILGIRAAHFSYQLSIAWRTIQRMEKIEKEQVKPHKQEFPDGGLEKNTTKNITPEAMAAIKNGGELCTACYGFGTVKQLVAKDFDSDPPSHYHWSKCEKCGGTGIEPNAKV